MEYFVGDEVLFTHGQRLRVGEIILKNPRYYVIKYIETNGRENAILRSVNGRGIRGRI